MPKTDKEFSIIYHTFFLHKRGKADEPLLNEDALKEITGEDDYLSSLLGLKIKIQEFFDGKFYQRKTTAQETASNTVINIRDLTPNKDQNTVFGYANIGETGYNRDYFDVKNAKDSSGKIGKHQTLPYQHFFILYLPPNLKFGIIGLQNFKKDRKWKDFYSSIKRFFGTHKLYINSSPAVPQRVVDNFKNKSSVKQVHFKPSNPTTARAKLSHPSKLIPEDKPLKMTISFTGLDEPADVFFSRIKGAFGGSGNGKITGSHLGFKDSDIELEMSVTLEDTQGRKGRANRDNNGEFHPVIYLPEYLKEEDELKLNLSETSDYCFNQHIEQLAKELIRGN